MKIVKAICVLAVFAAVLATWVSVHAQGGSAQALALAMDYFRVNARAYGLSDPDRELAVRTIREQGNRVVIRFDQYYRGLKVFEGEAIARVSNGRVDVTNALRRDLSLNTDATISGEQAIATASRAIGARGPVRSSSSLE